jgi:glycosyltransferase involved in cell wall biosynthesis
MTDGKITVLHVCDHLGWEGSRMHGVKRLFSWIIPRFDTARFDVSLVSLRRKDLSEEPLERYGVRTTYLSRGKFDPATITDLLKVIDRRRVDVLHMHGYGATNFGRLAAAVRSLPTIVHEHCNLVDAPWYQKMTDRALEPLTDIALAVSQSTADFTRSIRKIRPEKVKVVYLGAPMEEFRPIADPRVIAGARGALGLGPQEFAVGCVTRLQEQKGNQYLIDAARLVLDQRPQARFFIAGEGPLRAELESHAALRQLGDRLTFLGFVQDVPRLMAAFDLSVFPSLWEGTPLTAFEALGSGKPIVATNADGLVEILGDGQTALIVPSRDAAALADKIVWMLDHPEERARFGAAARAAAARYDINAFVRKMERLYEHLLVARQARPRRSVLNDDLSFLTA